MGIPVDGNSLFESVAHQINDPAYNGNYLRNIAVCQGIETPEKYMYGTTHSAQDIKKWRTEINALRRNLSWQADKSVEIIQMLSDALKKKIVIVRNEAPEMVIFGKEGSPINDKTIIVIENDSNVPEYHSTSVSESGRYQGNTLTIYYLCAYNCLQLLLFYYNFATFMHTPFPKYAFDSALDTSTSFYS